MDKQPLIELQDLSQTATNISSKITYTLTSNSTNNQGQYIFQPINSSDNYHFGNLKTFFFDKNNIPQIVIGPDYQQFLCMFLFSIFIQAFFIISLYKLFNTIIMCITIAICMTQLSCYLIVFLKNPGLACFTAQKYTEISYESDRKNEDEFPCGTCRIIKFKGVLHCPDCNVCIEECDHHCPWMGGCVGKGNQLAFNWFLGSSVFCLFYLLILCLI